MREHQHGAWPVQGKAGGHRWHQHLQSAHITPRPPPVQSEPGPGHISSYARTAPASLSDHTPTPVPCGSFQTQSSPVKTEMGWEGLPDVSHQHRCPLTAAPWLGHTLTHGPASASRPSRRSQPVGTWFPSSCITGTSHSTRRLVRAPSVLVECILRLKLFGGFPTCLG